MFVRWILFSEPDRLSSGEAVYSEHVTKIRHLRAQITPKHVARGGHYQVILPVPGSCTKAACGTRTACILAHRGGVCGCMLVDLPPEWQLGSKLRLAAENRVCDVEIWWVQGRRQGHRRVLHPAISSGDTTYVPITALTTGGPCQFSLGWPLSDLCLRPVWAFSRESAGEAVHAPKEEEDKFRRQAGKRLRYEAIQKDRPLHLTILYWDFLYLWKHWL